MGACCSKSRSRAATVGAPMPKKEAKLEEPQRRRLSVSVVTGDRDLPEFLAAKSSELNSPTAAGAARNQQAGSTSAAPTAAGGKPAAAAGTAGISDAKATAAAGDGAQHGGLCSSADSDDSDDSSEEEDEEEAARAAAVEADLLDVAKRLDSMPRRARRVTELGSPSSKDLVVAAPAPRAPLRKLDDAADSLCADNGGVKDVTLRMIAALVAASKHSYLVFGDPADCQQRGFDHKKLATAGTLSSSHVDLQKWGIGYACKKGFKPESPNQDDFFVCLVDDWFLLGVFDGHGPFGHDVSSFVHRTLPYLLLSDPEWEKHPQKVFRRAFRRVHDLLERHAMTGALDCALSGTTATVVLLRDKRLICAWVGDSRAVVCGGSGAAADLSVDHKPTLPEERARIESQGGEVRKLDGDIPHRVFIRGRLYPGLAMSRAIGDSVGAVVGVTSEAEISERAVADKDEYLIVASDGVWEFIDSQEAAQIVTNKANKEGIQKAASYLAYEAWRRWVQEEENVVDDVTCVVLKL